MLRSLVLLAAAATLAATLVASAGATATSFELVFDGRHVPATFLTPTGLVHAGTFTASGPVCGTGTAADVTGPPVVLRRYACDDGSGTFTLQIDSELGEHDPPLLGTWRIVDGSGAYEHLRGKGTFTAVATGGSILDFSSVTFTTTSTGVAGFDDVAPTLEVSRTTLKRVDGGSYRVAFALSARDDSNAVSYDLVVTAPNGNRLAIRSGTAGSGAASVPVSLRTRGGRTLRVAVTVADALGNETTAVRKIRVPA
jgi:hypothetical protein